MKKINRPLSILLIPAACLALLCACAVPGSAGDPSGTPFPSVSEEPSETPSATPAPEPSEATSEAPSHPLSPSPAQSPALRSDPPDSLPPEPSASLAQPGMALDRNELVFTAMGDTFQLTVTLSGTDGPSSVIWTSSDEGVATVGPGGSVTAVSPGTATITAMSGSGLAASCIVRCRWEPASPQPGQVDLSAFAAGILSQYPFGSATPATDEAIGQHFPGLDAIGAQQRLVYLCQAPKNDAELVLVEVANPGDVGAVKAILQARIDAMVSGGAWFPEATQVWTDHSRITVQGTYIMLVVHTQCDAVVSAFQPLFS